MTQNGYMAGTKTPMKAICGVKCRNDAPTLTNLVPITRPAKTVDKPGLTLPDKESRGRGRCEGHKSEASPDFPIQSPHQAPSNHHAPVCFVAMPDNPQRQFRIVKKCPKAYVVSFLLHMTSSASNRADKLTRSQDASDVAP